MDGAVVIYPTTTPDCTFSSPEQAAPECSTTILPTTSLPGTDSCDWLINPPPYPECETTSTTSPVDTSPLPVLPVTGIEQLFATVSLALFMIFMGIAIAAAAKKGRTDDDE